MRSSSHGRVSIARSAKAAWPSSPARAAAWAARTRWSSPGRARRSWSTTSAWGRTAGTAATLRRRKWSPRSSRPAAGAVADHHDIATWDGAARSGPDRARRLRQARRAGQQRRLPAGPDAGQPLASRTGTTWSGSTSRATSCTLRHAGAHWRDQYKMGNLNDARVINTSSGAGLLGSVGQGNYAAAKAGIAALTIQAAAELGRYGVTVNAHRPGRPHPHDRGPLQHDDGRAGGRIRRDGPGERLAAGGLARLGPVRARSAAASSRSRAAASASPTAGSTARPPTRAPAGTRPNSTRWWRT